jgi:hypothetical protein
VKVHIRLVIHIKKFSHGPRMELVKGSFSRRSGSFGGRS